MANKAFTTRGYNWATAQVVSYDASTQSTAIQPGEYALSATTDAWIKVAADPTASAADGSMLLPAGVIFTFIITDADSKIAAIKQTTAGKLSIVPVL